jgi:hypothetical protein
MVDVGISADELAKIYPCLYHMAEPGSWPSICQLGLLSTRALLDQLGVTVKERTKIESTHRPESMSIYHAKFGRVTFRDQAPMNERILRRKLDGMEPREWYEFLNGMVFFWATEQRVMELSKAKLYRDRTHCVLTVNTRELLKRYEDRVRLSPINSGSTIYNAKRRGRDTFLPLNKYPFAERKALRGRANAVAELTVQYAVPDIRDFTIEVRDIRAGNVEKIVYPAPNVEI